MHALRTTTTTTTGYSSSMETGAIPRTSLLIRSTPSDSSSPASTSKGTHALSVDVPLWYCAALRYNSIPVGTKGMLIGEGVRDEGGTMRAGWVEGAEMASRKGRRVDDDRGAGRDGSGSRRRGDERDEGVGSKDWGGSSDSREVRKNDLGFPQSVSLPSNQRG